MSAEGLWKYLEAEALDAAQSHQGRLAKALIIVELDGGGEHRDQVRRLVISRHHSGRRLRPSEQSGLLALSLADTLDP